MDIFESLRADHDIQRDLIARLVETTGDSDDRREIFSQLRTELSAHAGAEERYLYVPLMEVDLTQEKARHSVAEHKELDDFVDQLEAYETSGSAWLPTAKDLQHKLIHHLDEEEHEVFQLAGKALTNAQKTELASDYRSDMDRRRE